MNGKKVYEYAVLRVVPKVEREEFINVGVLLYSRHLRYIGIRWALSEEKLRSLDPDVDIETVLDYIRGFENICLGKKGADGIIGMEPADRFRWLTANRSSMMQTSCIHTGLTTDAAATLERLFEQMVL